MTITEKLHLMDEMKKRNQERVKEWKEKQKIRKIADYYIEKAKHETGLEKICCEDYAKYYEGLANEI